MRRDAAADKVNDLPGLQRPALAPSLTMPVELSGLVISGDLAGFGVPARR